MKIVHLTPLRLICYLSQALGTATPQTQKYFMMWFDFIVSRYLKLKSYKFPGIKLRYLKSTGPGRSWVRGQPSNDFPFTAHCPKEWISQFSKIFKISSQKVTHKQCPYSFQKAFPVGSISNPIGDLHTLGEAGRSVPEDSPDYRRN